MPSKKTPARERAVLSALEEGATFAEAARIAGITYSTLRSWRQSDARFREACALSLEAGTDLIEAEARRRAVQGVEKPVGFHQGRHTGLFVRDYSDSLLVLLLKARRPDVYRDGGAPKDIDTADMGGARDGLLRKFAVADEPRPAADTARKPHRR